MVWNPNRSPGITAGKTFDYRHLLKGGVPTYLPVGIFIDGSLSRDSQHTSYLDVLQAGIILGKKSSGDLYAPSIIGVLSSAYDASGTTTVMDLSVVDATELVRRIGTSGTFHISGPPTTAGTMSEYQDVIYSAVNLTTGVVTITAIAASNIAGSFIQPDDGSEVMRGFINREDGIKVTDQDDDDIDPNCELLIGGIIDTSQIIRVPSNAVLLQWLKDKLNATAAGQFVFDDLYI